jgi:hypothetical protein
MPSIEPRPIDDFFPQLAEAESVVELLKNEYGDKAPAVIDAMKSRGEIPAECEYFDDWISELMSEKEQEVCSFEFECLSSYSDTSTVEVVTFCGIYWIKNFEFGDICYFSSEAGAREAAEEAFNFEWPE